VIFVVKVSIIIFSWQVKFVTPDSFQQLEHPELQDYLKNFNFLSANPTILNKGAKTYYIIIKAYA